MPIHEMKPVGERLPDVGYLTTGCGLRDVTWAYHGGGPQWVFKPSMLTWTFVERVLIGWTSDVDRTVSARAYHEPSFS